MFMSRATPIWAFSGPLLRAGQRPMAVVSGGSRWRGWSRKRAAHTALAHKQQSASRAPVDRPEREALDLADGTESIGIVSWGPLAYKMLSHVTAMALLYDYSRAFVNAGRVSLDASPDKSVVTGWRADGAWGAGGSTHLLCRELCRKLCRKREIKRVE